MAAEVLKVSNLVKFLDNKQILHDVNFSIQEGEVFGFLWPNGAGKTTTLKCILRLIQPNEGAISLFDSAEFSREIRNQIGFMPENPYLYKYLTGEEFLHFIGNLFQLPKNIIQERTDELLKKVGLEDARDKHLNSYSKGMLQRIGLAQAIFQKPKMVFFDEPMSGLDPIGRKMVKDLILELKNEGVSVFFNTHILSDVSSICDHFAIIHHGHIVAEEYRENFPQDIESYFMEKINNSPY